jgi:hypothetical protein
LLVLSLVAACHLARADVGVVLADPTSIGVSQYTHAGHSLVYLSGVCAESPVRARLCQPGEQGSVVTTYPDFRENIPYSWNLVPLSLYLHGTLTPGERPLYSSANIKEAMELRARETYLRQVCADAACPQVPHSFWRDIVDATAVRDVFVFAVHTTPEQDQIVVDWLNKQPNENHYNGLTNNCAVFTRSLVNLLFPHAVHRDFPNDLGMMAPKAAARSFTHWALKRPELGFYTMHFAQQPGDLPRSGLAQSGTETGFHMKKYFIPAALIGDHEVAGSFLVAYFLTGRFGIFKEYSHHPSSSILELEFRAKAARKEDDSEASATFKAAANDVRDDILGSEQDWDSYRERFMEYQDSPEARELTPGKKRYFPKQYDSSKAEVDGSGAPWLTVEANGISRKVGISSSNVLSDSSDPSLAYQLMLGRIGYALHAKNHSRETLVEFEKDWTLLEASRDRLRTHREQQTLIAKSR